MDAVRGEEAVHVDEREPALHAATEGRTPCVAAETDDDGWFVLVDARELEACQGSPDALAAAITDALDRQAPPVPD